LRLNEKPLERGVAIRFFTTERGKISSVHRGTIGFKRKRRRKKKRVCKGKESKRPNIGGRKSILINGEEKKKGKVCPHSEQKKKREAKWTDADAGRWNARVGRCSQRRGREGRKGPFADTGAKPHI